jgi:hypothetical protein
MYKYTSELRADELGINRHCNEQIDIGIRADELGNGLLENLRILGIKWC